MSIILKSGASGNTATVDANGNVQVVTAGNTSAGVAFGGGSAAAPAIYSEVDSGAITGSRLTLSPETDSDYRLRIATDTFFDDETFNYLAQNTGRHSNLNTTMTFSYTTGGLITNAGAITTTTTGLSLATYAHFPFYSNGVVRYDVFEGGFTQQPAANILVDIGCFLRGAANPYAPTDGAYFRLTSAGLLGVTNHNGTETTVTLPFTYTNSRIYKFIIVTSNEEAQFWIDNTLYGTIPVPVGQAQPFMAASLPFAMRHAIVGGAAGNTLQFILRGYGVSYGGGNITRSAGEFGNGVYGSYQGRSGGTMGSLASYANSANPVAAVPTNTTALMTGLGGQVWETDTLAVTTDGIICSYQVPTGTVSVLGKRLKINGVKIDGYIQTALVGGGYNAQFTLAFGHTAVSLATAETVSTKAPRRIVLGGYSVPAAAAALVQLPTITLTLQNPIYVNPSEFIAVVKKKVGALAPTGGVVAHLISFDYSWE
jgi:hypothetical protein